MTNLLKNVRTGMVVALVALAYLVLGKVAVEMAAENEQRRPERNRGGRRGEAGALSPTNRMGEEKVSGTFFRPMLLAKQGPEGVQSNRATAIFSPRGLHDLQHGRGDR